MSKHNNSGTSGAAVAEAPVEAVKETPEQRAAAIKAKAEAEKQKTLEQRKLDAEIKKKEAEASKEQRLADAKAKKAEAEAAREAKKAEREKAKAEKMSAKAKSSKEEDKQIIHLTGKACDLKGNRLAIFGLVTEGMTVGEFKKAVKEAGFVGGLPDVGIHVAKGLTTLETPATSEPSGTPAA